MLPLLLSPPQAKGQEVRAKAANNRIEKATQLCCCIGTPMSPVSQTNTNIKVHLFTTLRCMKCTKGLAKSQAVMQGPYAQTAR